VKLFVENLSNVDISYIDAKRGLVGESWLAGLTLTGQLDNQSMICDFGIVKRNAKNWLDEHIDHKLVIPTQMPGIHITKHKDSTTVQFDHPLGGQFICSAPHEAFCLIETKEINTASVSSWIAKNLAPDIPGDIQAIDITLNTELIGGAYYHYSHGLKKHAGNCQRIAHGHRSILQIFIDGARQPELEKSWAKKWQDIYIGTKEDLHDQPAINNISHQHYQYETAQGLFSLTLPTLACYNMKSDTTVEQIANHIAKRFLQSGHSVTVKAFEGVGKGAIATYE